LSSARLNFRIICPFPRRGQPHELFAKPFPPTGDERTLQKKARMSGGDIGILSLFCLHIFKFYLPN
jgi:hypothetical protein